MKKVSHEELSKLVKTAYQKRVAAFIWGTIGIGKSQTIREVAKQLATDMELEFSEDNIEDGKFGFVDVRVSQLDPSDLRGLPKFDNDKTKWVPPSWLPRKQDGKGLIFMDELNLAPPSIQAASYQLILNRRLGDYVLPEGWAIVAAGNRSEDNARVFDLPSPLANRFIHCELNIPSEEEWTTWALNNGIDTRVVAFIKIRPSMLFRFEPKNRDKSFPTPRAWEFCSKLIKEIEKDSELEILIAAAVGEGCAIEMVKFLKLQKSIDFDAIMKNPAKVKELKDISMKYALLSYLSEVYRKDNKMISKMLDICEHLETEFAVILLRFCKSVNEKEFVKQIAKEKKWTPLSKTYGKYL